MAKLILFISSFALFYIYIGYPAAVYVLSRLRPKRVVKGPYHPKVTLLIAAYNEEKCIAQTLQNKLDIGDPGDNLEIIVVSDGSTDRTDEIVKSYESHGVRLIRQEPRAGKTSALNLGIREALGEIVVFSDANSMYEKDALRYLLENFNDPEVGYVTGRMIYTNPDGTFTGDGCSTYMKYENLLREYETIVGSIVGVDGGIDAVRKALYSEMNPDQLPDFVLPLRVIEQRYRVVYEPRAVLREPSVGSTRDEYRMRVRVSLRALWAMFDMRHLLRLKKNGLFAWEFFSHKWLRYTAFVFLVCCYLSNSALSTENMWYALLFILQTAFYLSALLALIFEKLGYKSGVLYIPYYFTLVNLASAYAAIKFSIGQKQILWTPRKG